MFEQDKRERPLPKDPLGLNEDIYRFWAEERLCFQRCTGCDTWRHLPRYLCANCGSPDWEWVESSGRGKIFSWSVTYMPMHPAFAADVPYASVVVEMEEGVRMVSGTEGLPIEALALDLPVEVVFKRVANDMSLPFFRPRNG